jgi:DNA-nicking Smr family endonuclease
MNIGLQRIKREKIHSELKIKLKHGYIDIENTIDIVGLNKKYLSSLLIYFMENHNMASARTT